MPIEGLTSNVSNERDARIGSYVQIGNIRKGKPKTDPKKPGREVDYFRIVPLEGEEEAAAEIFRLYGTDKPKMLRVLLPYDTLEAFWDTWREAYSAGGMIHRCNNDIVVRAADRTEEGKPCQRQHLPKQKGGCIPVGRLYVIIPEINRLAVWCVHTTSVHDLANMTRQLKGVYDTTEKLFGKGNGFYQGVPIILRRTPRMISTPGEEGKRVRRLKYLISIEVDPAWVAEAQRVLQQRALPGGAGPALPARVVVPGGHEPTEPPANWQRTSFVGDELDDEDDEAFVEGEVAVEASVEDDGAGDSDEADYEPPFPPGAGEGAGGDAPEGAAEGAGYDWLKARAKLVMRLKNGGAMTPQQAAELLEDLRRAGAIRTDQDDDSILAVARASVQAPVSAEAPAEVPADAGVPDGAPAEGETTDAPHWTAQPSKKRPGLTNWEAFVAAAADKWAYSEADILRCFRVAKPEAIAPDLEAAWAQLKAWDPQRDPDWAHRGDLLALIKLEVWLCPEGTDAAAVALLNAAHAGGAFDELPDLAQDRFVFEKLMAWALRNGYVKPGLGERLQAAREAGQKTLPEPEPADEPEQANMFAGKYYEEGL